MESVRSLLRLPSPMEECDDRSVQTAMKAARRRKPRRKREVVGWTRYAKAAGEFLGGFFGALRKAPKAKAPYLLFAGGVVLLMTVANVNVTITVDIRWVSLETRSGLVAETQTRPVDLRK